MDCFFSRNLTLSSGYVFCPLLCVTLFIKDHDEEEGSRDGEEREAVVVLEGGEFAEGGGDKRSGVEEESVVGGEGAGGEDVEEGGFSGAAGAHRDQDLKGEGGEGCL